MKRLLLTAVAALGAVPSAQATPILWNLNDVQFKDGGIATGWFTFDASTNNITDFSITVSGGDTGTFAPLTYSASNSSAYKGLWDGYQDYAFFLKGSTRLISFASSAELTNAGNPTDLVNAPFSAECYNCSPYRLFANPGHLTAAAVPEPASWALFIIGFGLIGAAVRRRQRTVVRYA